MQLKPAPGGYLVFATQEKASSNCPRCKRCPFGDILCLSLDSCLIFRLLISQKVKAARQTLTSPSVMLILNLFNYSSNSVI